MLLRLQELRKNVIITPTHCQSAGYATPDPPLLHVLDLWGHFFPESADKDNSMCTFWNRVQVYSGNKRDQLYIPKLFYSVLGNLMVNP